MACWIIVSNQIPIGVQYIKLNLQHLFDPILQMPNMTYHNSTILKDNLRICH